MERRTGRNPAKQSIPTLPLIENYLPTDMIETYKDSAQRDTKNPEPSKTSHGTIYPFINMPQYRSTGWKNNHFIIFIIPYTFLRIQQRP